MKPHLNETTETDMSNEITLTFSAGQARDLSSALANQANTELDWGLTYMAMHTLRLHIDVLAARVTANPGDRLIRDSLDSATDLLEALETQHDLPADQRTTAPRSDLTEA